MSQDACVIANSLTIKNYGGRSSFSDVQEENSNHPRLEHSKNVLLTFSLFFGTNYNLHCIISLHLSAKALQTILVLTGPQDLYKRWADKSQDLNVEWNMDAAKQVLEAWQRSFTEVKKKLIARGSILRTT